MDKHYHVVAGLRGGYLPNTNDMYPTKAAALEGAMWHVAQYREDGEKVQGSKRIGYWVARESESLPGVFWDYVRVSEACFDECEEYDG